MKPTLLLLLRLLTFSKPHAQKEGQLYILHLHEKQSRPKLEINKRNLAINPPNLGNAMEVF